MIFSQKNAPAATRGRSAANVPMLSIAQVGQGRFNTYATKQLLNTFKGNPSEVKEIYIHFDETGSRKMAFSLDAAKIKGAKLGDGIKASVGTKSGQLAFTISWIANQLGYNFKDSGNHSFSLESNKDGSAFSFVFPEGTLANTTVKRAPRKAKTVVDAPATEATPVTEDVE